MVTRGVVVPSSLMGGLFCLAISSAVIAVPQHAFAALHQKQRVYRIYVHRFRGPRRYATKLRSHVVRALHDHPQVIVVSPKEASTVAHTFHHRLSDPMARATLIQQMRADIWIEGIFERIGRRWIAIVDVYQSKNGKRVGGARWRSRFRSSLMKRVRRQFWPRLASVIEASEGPPPPPHDPPKAPNVDPAPTPPTQAQGAAPEPTVDTTHPKPKRSAPQINNPPPKRVNHPAALQKHARPKKRRPQPPSRPRQGAPQPSSEPQFNRFHLAASLVLWSRELRYARVLFPRYENQTINVLPAIHIRARWDPFAHHPTFIARPGLETELTAAIPIRQSDSFGRAYTTPMLDSYIGPRLDFPIGQQRLGIRSGYGMRWIGTKYSRRVDDPSFPETLYQFVAVGAFGHFELWHHLILNLSFKWLYVFSAGAIEKEPWVARSEAGAIEGEGRVGYRLTEHITLWAGFRLRHHGFDRGQPANPFRTTITTDQHRSVMLGVSWRLF